MRGRLDGERAGELLAFWAQLGALTGDAARERLHEVVCVLRGQDGTVAGVCSVYPTALAQIGGRRFWVFRSLLPGAAAEHGPAMIRETFAALEAEFDGAQEAPIGLCVLLGSVQERRRRPEAEWSDPQTIYAGYLDDGRQLRIAYFHGACIAPGAGKEVSSGAPLGPGYRIDAVDEQDAVSGQDLIKLWTVEGVLPPTEAQRRVDEVLLVATDEQRRAVGVSSAFLSRNEQLRVDMWHYRVFVAADHRKSALAVSLAMIGRDHLEQRFVSGADRRAPGMVFEVENEGLKWYFNRALWLPTQFLFIGENARGDHVRVRYFAGALAPEP